MNTRLGVVARRERPRTLLPVLNAAGAQLLAQEAVSTVLEGRRYSHGKVLSPNLNVYIISPQESRLMASVTLVNRLF